MESSRPTFNSKSNKRKIFIVIKSRINGLLISAGYSGRMGQFKPLMLYNGKEFVVNIVEKLLAVCEKVVVVTGFQKEKIEALINSQFSIINSQLFKKVEFVFNPNFDQGMFTSLQTGLAELKDSDWVLYHFVDQPFHEEKFYEEFISQIDGNYDWIQPSYNGKEGHPILFGKNVYNKILKAETSSSLRLIRDREDIKKKSWECNYSKILNDLDTAEDMLKL